MEGKDELDRAIDSALSGYSGAEPSAGLEQRVLSRVRVAEGERRRALGWTMALVAAAALLVAAIVVRAPHQSNPKSYRVAAVERPTPPIQEPRVRPVHRTRPRARRPRRLPKQEQFPAPTPLTAEERALLTFVKHLPAEAQKVFADLRKRADDPIEIQAIQIPPLRTDGAQ